MSKRVGDTFVIAVEPDGKCELCGTVAELRPYGPNGERICFKCAMKDEETTKKQFAKVLEGTQEISLNQAAQRGKVCDRPGGSAVISQREMIGIIATEALEAGSPAPTGSAAFGMDPTIQLTECKPCELKYWWEFSMWWQPRNTGTPSPADAQTWEQYQYYCAGRLDERTAVPPNATGSATPNEGGPHGT